MGVPTFYRWLTEKYPKIVVKAVEEFPTYVGGAEVPVNPSDPNPNKYEFDNLYLDMNGIIHPCTHPEGEEAPPTEKDMYKAIFKYLDRLFNLVRPRKLVYMAIDGVAPRAKMNQQRSRRFRAAQEAEEAEEDAEKIRQEIIDRGQKPPGKKPPMWDSNVITPGTPFMAKLAKWLRAYIVERQNTSEAWKNVKVILSDAQSPGEGEHKIMQYIRRQRAEPGYDPNTKHCLYGLDADLIMLGLATHEIHFSILREEVLFGKQKHQQKNVPQQVDQVLLNSDNATGGKSNAGDTPVYKTPPKPFEILRVWVLREYLKHEFRAEAFYQKLPFTYDFERCIDDFIFLCFFVGNDFLPHLPSLSIREGGLELLIDLYKRTLPSCGGFLTRDGDVNLSRVDVIMGVLGSVEDEIFSRRRRNELRMQRRRQDNKNNKSGKGSDWKAAEEMKQFAQPLGKKRKEAPGDQANLSAAAALRAKLGNNDSSKIDDASKQVTVPGLGGSSSVVPGLSDSITTTKSDTQSGEKDQTGTSSTNDNTDPSANDQEKPADAVTREESESKNQEYEEESKEESTKESSKNASGSDDDDEDDLDFDTPDSSDAEEVNWKEETGEHVDNSKESKVAFKAKLEELEKKRTFFDDVPDHVRLGEDGWRDRYYESKFGEEAKDPNLKRRVVESYVIGLCWVMQYYYKGCQSWKWYFEFHYAPFASDMVNIDSIKIEFPPSRPFSPVEQLMGVLPAKSSHALPKPCRPYMCDPSSEIADFYPRKFQYDPNGKGVRWLWIALLPFIEEKRLLAVVKKIQNQFTEKDKERSKLSPDFMFIHSSCPGFDAIAASIQNSTHEEYDMRNFEELDKLEVTPKTTGDVRGSGKLPPLVTCAEGGGVSGYFIKPSPKVELKLNQEIQPPKSSNLAVISNNQVLLCDFRLPAMRPHLSHLLEGVSIPEPMLDSEDLKIRRPRLGRGMDISNLLSQVSHQLPGNFQNNQQHNQDNLNMSRTGMHRTWQSTQRSWGSAEPRDLKRYRGGGGGSGRGRNDRAGHNPFLNQQHHYGQQRQGYNSNQQPPHYGQHYQQHQHQGYQPSYGQPYNPPPYGGPPPHAGYPPQAYGAPPPRPAGGYNPGYNPGYGAPPSREMLLNQLSASYQNPGQQQQGRNPPPPRQGNGGYGNQYRPPSGGYGGQNQ